MVGGILITFQESCSSFFLVIPSCQFTYVLFFGLGFPVLVLRSTLKYVPRDTFG